jgi:hypothetical protein
MTIVRDVIPVSPWQVLDCRHRGERLGQEGVQAILDARARDIAGLRGGVPVAVLRPDGTLSEWVVSAVEVLHDVPALFIAGATEEDVPPGSRLTWVVT